MLGLIADDVAGGAALGARIVARGLTARLFTEGARRETIAEETREERPDVVVLAAKGRHDDPDVARRNVSRAVEVLRACGSDVLPAGDAGAALDAALDALSERSAVDRRRAPAARVILDARAQRSGALVVVGATTPATAAQVDFMAFRGARVVTLGAQEALDENGAAAALDLGADVVLQVEAVVENLQSAHTRVEALARVAARALARSSTGRLVVLGGDASAAVCRACGVESLSVVEELEPGVVALAARAPRPLGVVLASGASGAADSLVRAIDRLDSLGRETIDFPAGFAWGAATSAYQIEGSVHADGRGASIWDAFLHATPEADAGDVACDHYRRYEDDVALIGELGLRAYRFSIAWPRVCPDGRRVELRGLDFYRRLVDALLARGVAPAATLYHWDLPLALQEAGGWPARDTALRFADYADVVFRALGDRVKLWMTHNEPWCSGFLGHFRGVHAPGGTDLGQALAATHHMLLSHGLAVRALRASSTEARAGRIGIVTNVFPTYPKSSRSAADVAAARLSDGFTTRWFLDPLYRGRYPDDAVEHFARFGASLPVGHESDAAVIASPTDFLGVNYYHRRLIDSSPGHDLGWTVIDRSPGVPLTGFGWEIVPYGLTDALVRLHRDYAPKAIFVTENGAVYDDAVAADGAVHDGERVAFLRAHFAAARRALDRGVPLEGYFVWSLLDNLEWAFGYAKRFGVVHVDFATQRRVVKDSGRFLAQVIRDGGFRP